MSDFIPSYFEHRMAQLGITEDLNQVNLWRTNIETVPHTNELAPVPIFREHIKGIEIIVYTLDRTQPTFDNTTIDEKGKLTGSKIKKQWSIIRLEHPITTKNGTMKYQMPKGQGSYPFFPPALLDKFDAKTPIKSLFITEGFFKAFKASMHGLDIVGIPSITHLKNKEGELHKDIKELIRICKVQRVVWLTDGDCFDLSKKANDAKEEVDLRVRPNSFYQSIATFKAVLDDIDAEKYFMHIDCDNILNEKLKEDVTRNDIKGIDDLLCAFPERANEIIADATTVANKGYWFGKYNISISTGKVLKEFRLNSVNDFFLWHVDRKEIDINADFIFSGTRYRYNSDKGECEIISPADSKLYCRVGTSYYKFVQVPNKYKQLERVLKLWDKGTITDDHNKNFLKHIPKYQEFCNVPDHVNYQQVINSCFNVYMPLDYTPSDEPATSEDCPTILGFIHHIFGDGKVHFKHPETGDKREISMMDMALDYIQLLYQQPALKLPILCLVSKENNTGKSTFGKLLKQILGGNCAVVGNQDLAGDFNKHWATKCLVICDETKIDKQVVIEKVKSLSTAEKIMMNSKGKDHVEIDCFIKFIFITNNEENFMYMSEDDIRYWVVKVPTIKKENPGMMEDMIEEIPFFLSYLNQRKLVTERMNRMWFHPSLLKTEALKKVIAFSKPTIEKELIQYAKDVFMDFGVEEFYMAADDVRSEVFKNRYERNYINNVLKNNFKLEQYHVFEYEGKEYATLDMAQNLFLNNPSTENHEWDAARLITRKYKVRHYSYPRWEEVKEMGKATETKRVEVKKVGRPYVFKREQFLTAEEIATIKVSPEDAYINGMTPEPLPPIGFVTPNTSSEIPLF